MNTLASRFRKVNSALYLNVLGKARESFSDRETGPTANSGSNVHIHLTRSPWVYITIGFLTALGCLVLRSVWANPDNGPLIELASAGGPADLITSRDGSEVTLVWAEREETGWQLHGVRLDSGGRTTTPTVSVELPWADTLPTDVAIGWADEGRMLVAWTDAGKLWVSTVGPERRAASEPVLISGDVQGRIDVVNSAVIWSEGGRTRVQQLEASGTAAGLNFKSGQLEILDSRFLAAGSFEKSILVIGETGAVLLDHDLKPSLVLGRNEFLTDQRSAPELAIAGRGGHRVLAWADARGRIAIRPLDRPKVEREVRAADGTPVRDLNVALHDGGGWVTWIEIRLDGEVRRVKGLPDLFADDFETGDTSAWSSTEPPINLHFVSPTTGGFVNDSTPTIEVAYNTPTGVGVDPSSLLWEKDGSPLAMTCNTSADGADCVPDAPFDDGSVTLITTVADLLGQLSIPQTVTFTVDTDPPTLEILSPEDGLLTSASEVAFTGQVSEQLALQMNGETVGIEPDLSFSKTLPLATDGAHVFAWTAEDAAGNLASLDRTVTRDTLAPAALDLSGLVVTLDGGQLQVTGDAGTVESNTRVRVTNQRTGAVVEVLADDNGAFSASIAGEDRDLLSFEVIDGADNVSDSVSVPSPFDLPPDPADIAPPLDRTVATQMGDALEFLWTGSDPVQVDVLPNAIDTRRIAWIRGQVLDRDGGPVPGVTVRALGKTELGWTRSRSDGLFDLVVNGGGAVVVNFERSDYLRVQREVRVPWRESVWMDDVVLTAFDPAVTSLAAGATEVQVARATAQTDGNGTRTATVLFPAGTTAQMVMPDGSEIALSSLDVRATEYTVGLKGPQAMPGSLPVNVGYTYAVELSVDAAVTAGARRVDFSTPLPFYVENFLDFPVGEPVPLGNYDRETGQWVGYDNGIVLEILSVDGGGLAQIDLEGLGLPADASDLAALSFTDAERATLANLYTPGTNLWRALIPHFSPWDCNWPWGPPDFAVPPPEPFDPPPDAPDNPDDPDNPNDPDDPKDPDNDHDEGEDSEDDPCSEIVDGSIIECENQTMRQRIPVVGAPVDLWYSSSRVEGRIADFSLRVPVTGDSVPNTVISVEVEVISAGRRITRSFPAEPNQTWDVNLSNRDGFGRPVTGEQPVKIRRGYTYNLQYRMPGRDFDQSWSLYPQGSYTTARMREGGRITMWRDTASSFAQVLKQKVRRWDARGQQIGGFTVGLHHAYDPNGRKVEHGDGSHGSAWSLGPVVRQHAAGFDSPTDIAIGPDGTLYVADGPTHRVWAVDQQGGVTPFAGDGTPCQTEASDDPDWDPLSQCGQGEVATSAQLLNPWGLGVGRNGDVYIADRSLGCVRRVDAATGILETVGGFCDSDGAGNPGIEARPSNKVLEGDGGPATETNLGVVSDVAVRSDGAFFVATSNGVRQVGTNGILSTTVEVSGGGGGGGGLTAPNTKSEGEPPTAADTPSSVNSLAFGPNGNLYLTDPSSHHVFALSVDGVISVVAGTGAAGSAADHTPATEADLDRPTRLFVNADRRVYFVEQGNRWLRRFDSDNALYTTTGDGNFGSPVDGEAALAASYGTIQGITQSTDGDLYILADGTIWRIGLALEGFSEENFVVPSAGGAQVYEFDHRGRHLQTRHGLTGATLYTFGYDEAGRLTTLTDADNLVTIITRDEATGDATAIVGPFGQTTSLMMDAAGYLESVSNPAGETWRFQYIAGLMTRFEDPRFEAEGYGEDEVKTYEYDGLGRLTQANDAENGFTSFRRQGQAGQPNYEVRRRTSHSVTTRNRQWRSRSGTAVKVRTAPDRTTTRSTRTRSGVSTTTLPDGSTVTSSSQPDPRFGLLAGFSKAGSLERPGGQIAVTSGTRSVTLSDPADPFSITTQSHTSTIDGRTATSSYDGTTGQFTTTSPELRTRSLNIDQRGRITAAALPQVQPLAVTYLPTGEVDHVTVGSGSTSRVTDFSYDALHRLQTVTDPEGFAVTYGYDSANRMTTLTLPDLQSVAFDHDALGNIITVTPPGQPAHTFTYNKRNQLETYTQPDAGAGTATETRIYDDARRLTRIIRPDSQEIGFGYEPFRNRLQTLTIPRGDLTFTFQPDGKLDTATTFDGQTLDFTYDGPVLSDALWAGTINGSVERTYDNSLRLDTLKVNGVDPVTYTYDDDSLLLSAGALSLDLDSDTGRVNTVTLDQITTAWTYTPFGEPEKVTTRHGTTVIYEETFVYDKRGWITDLTRIQNGSTALETFGYDSRGRLETVHQDDIPRASYTYDTNSNRTSYEGPFPNIATTAYDSRDRLTQYGDTTYTYTEAGELTSKSANGQTVSYDYDVLGNLRHVVLDTGITLDYVIDSAQRRIGKKVEGVLVKGWLYQNGLNPIAELDGPGNVVSRFVYGTRPNVPDYMVRGGITYRIVADHLGSPRLVVDASTGVIAQELRYDEFGRITLDTNPGFQPFGFAGGLYDHQTGLVRLGARDYDPELGRWTTPDPVGFLGGDTNLFIYAGANPVVWVDPSGLSIGTAARGFAKGAVAGLAFGVGASVLVGAVPAAGVVLAAAGAVSLATAYYEGVAAYYDPEVSDDAMHEFVGTVAGSVVGCAVGFKGHKGGRELTFGKGFGDKVRLAPFGNRTSNPLGRWPHYHRRVVSSDGKPVSGQGLGRHRPWETKSPDRSFWDRF